MDKRLYFYSPGDNFYDAPMKLFVVAKYSVRDNGIHWLEPNWTAGPIPELNGLTLFVSKLDAFIYSMMLNKYNNENWSVYPFSDINITEMMIDVAPNQVKYAIHMIFGFAVDNNGNLLSPDKALITKGYVEDFVIQSSLSSLSPITIRFNKEYFKQMNESWTFHYQDFCKEIDILNEKNNEEIYKIATDAILKIKVTKKYNPSHFGQISHYSHNKNQWIVSY